MRWILVLALAACGGSPPPAPEAKEAAPAKVVPEKKATPAPPAEPPIPAQHTALFKPLQRRPLDTEDKALIDLGRQLYYDTRLSLAHDISCNSCHQLDKFGVDNEPTSPGHKGQRGARNSPTTYNAFLHVAQFWDGRAADVEEQAKGPILNPVEMAMPSEEVVVATLKSIPGYVEAFDKAFITEDTVTYDNMAEAIGAFERRLVTPGRFDAYLMGDASALTDAEKKGLDTFIATGCSSCHMGATLGGTQYMKLGAVEPYETKDEGRFEVTEADADRYVFKVPSLRNVAKTAPYLHDGSVGTLDEAIRLMAKHQLGKALQPEEVTSIKTFLEALTGEVDQAFVAKPTLPESGPDTPGPVTR
jgi:cytochrome c peroxidase